MEEAEFKDSGEAWSTRPDPSDHKTLQADAGAACLPLFRSNTGGKGSGAGKAKFWMYQRFT